MNLNKRNNTQKVYYLSKETNRTHLKNLHKKTLHHFSYHFHIQDLPLHLPLDSFDLSNFQPGFLPFLNHQMVRQICLILIVRQMVLIILFIQIATTSVRKYIFKNY